MHKIIVGASDEFSYNKQLLEGMYRLRSNVFHSRLKWSVETSGGLETDFYDQCHPVYMIVESEDGQAIGCWRFLPTTGPYMLRDTFPVLLRGEEPPCDPTIWELSRFAVDTTEVDRTQHMDLNAVTYDMIRSLIEFAEQNSITSYVTVTAVGLERLLKRTGIPLLRFGDKTSTRIGKVGSVACWVPVNETFRKAVGYHRQDQQAA